MRLLLMAFLGCGLLAVLAGCGNGGPTLAARSDRQGTLTIKGSHWHSCGSMRIALPAPWGSSVTKGSATFRFQYPVPLVKPYAGRVVVTQRPCDGDAALTASTTIDVHDARSAP